MESIVTHSTILSGFSTCPYLNNLEETSISLSIPNNACNSDSLITFDLSIFFMLQSVTIGNENFMYSNEFVIDELNELKSLKIGYNSFTKEKNDYGNDTSRSFSILNCVELESIEIGSYSFSDYGGGFELNNLPKLSTIIIGQIGSFYGSRSFNFFFSSFEINGIIDMILLMNRSSKFEFD